MISTHTLRGERDGGFFPPDIEKEISTHTLRGERDNHKNNGNRKQQNFNSHAPWGA